MAACGDKCGHRTTEAGSVEPCTKGSGPDTGLGIDGDDGQMNRPFVVRGCREIRFAMHG